MNRKYTLGVDFGTLSCRALLIDVRTGEEMATAVMDYPHAVLDAALPDGTPLGHDWALQDPADYLLVISRVIPQAIQKAGIDPQDIIGVGIDFTANTVLPMRKDGTPLCMLPAYKSRPHAYAKLWKHHAGQPYASRITSIAKERGEAFLDNYGGKVSSEWMLPKMWQTVEEDPALYDEADDFIEAVDWIILKMTGEKTRSIGAAGYKSFWDKQTGFLSPDFLAALHPKLANFFTEKYTGPLVPLGGLAGRINEAGAALTGLCVGTPVAAGNVDAPVCVPSVGLDGPGKMMMVMGTSTCHWMVSKEKKPLPGLCGVVEDGILPGYFCYEAGQSCVGDHFAWFVENCVPESYFAQAKAEGKNIYDYLRSLCEQKKPGESGLLALDWWNGNRSMLVDMDLTGVLLGMTLRTKPEDIYRALIEATAFGTRVITESFQQNGMPIHDIIAAGGIPQKDPMTMQIYADVLHLPMHIAATKQGAAMGSAMYGAVAAGKEAGGYETVFDAIHALTKLREEYYVPDPENAAIYDRLYAEYKRLHDYFGRGENDVMKRLKAIRDEQTRR